MSLTALFLPHAQEEARARFAATPDLEPALAALADAGRRAWPYVRVDTAELLAFLGRCLPADALAQPASIQAGDLYLVCAYGLGAPGAATALEAHAMTRVEQVLARLRTPPATIADIQQELRERLVEMRVSSVGVGPGRRGYSGRGDLASWLCVSAVRMACRLRERESRQQPLADGEAEELPTSEADPEASYLRVTRREEFQAAFRQALDSLTLRERNVLRYHFIDGLSIDQLGALYAVHRATAARWIERAREALSLRTRDLLAQRGSLSRESLRRLIDSQLSVQLDVAQA